MRVDENGVLAILIDGFLHQNINFWIFLQRSYLFEGAGFEEAILDISASKELHNFVLVDGVSVKLLNDLKLTVPEDRIYANFNGFALDFFRKLPEYFEEEKVVHHL